MLLWVVRREDNSLPLLTVWASGEETSFAEAQFSLWLAEMHECVLGASPV